MVRRAASGWILGIALLAASVAWAGFTLQRTIFDPSRTAKVADQLLTDSTVRDYFTTGIVSAVDKGLPEQLRRQIPTEQLVSVANTVLASPAARADIEKALVDTHRYMIGDIETPPTLNTATLDAVMRQTLLDTRPDLAAVVPSIPPLQLPLPSTGILAMHGVRKAIDTGTPLAALAAVVIALGAVAISPDRGSVFRRIGRWALAAGLLWVVLRFAVAPFTARFLPASSSLLGGLARAVADRMAGPGVVMMMFGASCLALGGLCGWFRRRRRHAAQEGGDRYAELAGRTGPSSKRGRKAQAATEAAAAAAAETHARAQAQAAAAAAAAHAEQLRAAQAAQAAAAAQVTAASAPPPPVMPSFLPPMTQNAVGAAPTGPSLSPLGTPNALPTSFMSPSALPNGFSYGGGANGGAANGGAANTAGPVAARPPKAPDIPALPTFMTPSLGSPPNVYANGTATITPPMGAPAAPPSQQPPSQQPPTWGRSSETPAINARPRRPAHLDAPQELPPTLAGRGVPLSDPRFPGNWLGGFTLDPNQHPRVADPAPPPPRWVEGVGYVFEYPPFEGVLWVEGLGYVVTEQDLDQLNTSE